MQHGYDVPRRCQVVLLELGSQHDLIDGLHRGGPRRAEHVRPAVKTVRPAPHHFGGVDVDGRHVFQGIWNGVRVGQ